MSPTEGAVETLDSAVRARFAATTARRSRIDRARREPLPIGAVFGVSLLPRAV